jgi:hypothetical protein
MRRIHTVGQAEAVIPVMLDAQALQRQIADLEHRAESVAIHHPDTEEFERRLVEHGIPADVVEVETGLIYVEDHARLANRFYRQGFEDAIAQVRKSLGARVYDPFGEEV